MDASYDTTALVGEVVPDIRSVAANEWNALAGAENIFMRHEFLSALESSGSVGQGSGWEPRHLLLRDSNRQLCAAMPAYRKTNSWGEFVFDFAWADAYRRAGLEYYPKLVTGIPYTPATGPRLLVRETTRTQTALAAMIGAAQNLAEELGASSWHVLFPDETAARALADEGLLLRKDCQFHWRNADYGSFDDFLGGFTSAKRKKVKRERRRVKEAGVAFRVLTGEEIDTALWAKIMPLYASSFWRRGREPYLNQAFFETVAQTLADQLVVILAEFQREPIAVAICFRSQKHLYGRYWGAVDHFHSLHFETCYYRGIDYCIAEGLQVFEPGTQGEHKISRGFVPTPTWSAHWLSHPQFAVAVEEYLGRERLYIDEYMDAASGHVPYRKERG